MLRRSSAIPGLGSSGLVGVAQQKARHLGDSALLGPPDASGGAGPPPGPRRLIDLSSLDAHAACASGAAWRLRPIAWGSSSVSSTFDSGGRSSSRAASTPIATNPAPTR